jgi:hypothetical protein
VFQAFIGMNHGALGDPQPDGRGGVRLGGEHLRQRVPAALTHGDDNPALARLGSRQPNGQPGQQPGSPVGCGHEVGAVDLGGASFAADAQRFRGGCHGLAQLVREYCTSRSRQNASMLLPFTSLQKTAMAILSGSLCQANRVPEVAEKSARHALQRQRGWCFRWYLALARLA